MSMQGVMPGHRLLVHIVRAEGLNHMNHFTGDHPYCVCEVQHFDKNVQATKVETQPVTSGDTLNPVWDEAWEIEPWYQGEALEFTVYDKGLVGSKTEGKVVLPSESFFPNGFNGMLSISGLEHATLQVEIQIVGSSGGAELPAPVPTVMSYGAPGSQFATSQTYTASQAPQMVYAAPPMVTYAAASQPIVVMAQQPMTYSVPPAGVPGMATTTTYAAPAASTVYAAPAQFGTTYAAPGGSVGGPQQIMVPGMTQAAGPQKIAVSILQAHGLQHMNHFTGDHPYVVCEVKHRDSSREATKVETKPVTSGDTLNPFWGETHTLGPWHEGESLEFTVYDKGLIGSKTEGKVVLGPELFFPNGFSGMLTISGLPQAMLHVIIRPLGPMEANNAPVETLITDGASLSKKKKKKVKVSKKSKGCC